MLHSLMLEITGMVFFALAILLFLIVLVVNSKFVINFFQIIINIILYPVRAGYFGYLEQIPVLFFTGIKYLFIIFTCSKCIVIVIIITSILVYFQ